MRKVFSTFIVVTTAAASLAFFCRELAAEKPSGWTDDADLKAIRRAEERKERDKQRVRAELKKKDPQPPTAAEREHWRAGEVLYQGKWFLIADIQAAASEDPRLAEYAQRRAALGK